MNVEIEVACVRGFSQPVGPHELAWATALDAVFADACRSGLNRLYVRVPARSLVPLVEQRARLTPAGACGDGAAFLGVPVKPGRWRRVYTLRHGLLSLAPTAPVTGRWRIGSRLALYTGKSIAWGIPIRLAALLGRPGARDRAMTAMRRTFTSSRRTVARYHLTVWERL